MKLTLILSAIYVALFSAVCLAGPFTVAPVRLYFAPRDRAVAITLTNDSAITIALQADLHSWTQDAAGLDKLELSDDLIVAPSNIILAPNTKQTLRLALLVPRDASRQMTYRLIVREVPEVLAVKDAAVQLPIALALNIPVFITPADAKYSVSCELDKQALTKTVAVVCENEGNAYAQLRSIELKRAGKRLAYFQDGLYVLPGVKRTFQIDLSEPGSIEPGAADLTVTFDDRKLHDFSVNVP